jgi:hypothetical protein
VTVDQVHNYREGSCCRRAIIPAEFVIGCPLILGFAVFLLVRGSWLFGSWVLGVAVNYVPLADGLFIIGADSAGRMLELIGRPTEDDDVVLFHAMPPDCQRQEVPTMTKSRAPSADPALAERLALMTIAEIDAVRVTTDTRTALEAIAAAQGRRLADVSREALDEYVSRHAS